MIGDTDAAVGTIRPVTSCRTDPRGSDENLWLGGCVCAYVVVPPARSSNFGGDKLSLGLKPVRTAAADGVDGVDSENVTTVLTSAG